jgi:DNA-binding transcriptional regulator of glucitol operon
MTGVRARWLSKRAVSLHVAALVLVPTCAVAAWWQVNRAQDGNDLSYLYSVMWPVFGVLAVVFWWMLIHTDYETVGLKGMRRQLAASSAPPTANAEAPIDPSPTDDPELAAYNARLAALASQGPKTWRHRESVVVRRTP